MTHTFGWQRDALDHRDHTVAAPTLTKFPAKWSLRDGMPPIYDQGQLGSCTANAAAAIFDYDRKAQGLPFLYPARLPIYYNTRKLEGTINQDAGGQIRDAIKVLVKDGVGPESAFPYNIAKFKKAPSKAFNLAALKNEGIDYARVTQTQTAMQAVLYGDGKTTGRPIDIGFSCFSEFESDRVAQTGIVPMPSNDEQPIGGHSVDIEGWETIGKELYFEARNSYGDGWGIEGTFMIPAKYILTAALASDFWRMTSVTH